MIFFVGGFRGGRQGSEMGVAADLVIILLTATIVGFASHRLGVPLIIAYIITGVIIGPNTGGITVGDIHEIEMLAEIGVALLLFALGLELSLEKLKPVKWVALFGAPLQMAVCMAYGFGAGKLIGLDNIPSLWLGAMISLSSTMVILKTLMAQGRMGTLSSRVMIGMLVVQDIAVVPLVIALPIMNEPVAGLPLILEAVALATVFIGAMVLLGTRLLPKVFKIVAGWHSRELFLLVTTSIALGIGYGTYKIGLSFAFGAFVAGMVIGETEFGHQALSDIVPLRDIFGLLFFTSIGMLLDPGFIMANLASVALLVLLIIAGKALVFSGVTWLFGYRNVVPLAVALGLFQVGEFSFVLGRVGVDTGSITEAAFSLMLSAAVVTMVLTPFVSGLTTPLYRLQQRYFGGEKMRTIDIIWKELSAHVVIAGGGRVGVHIANTLREFGVESIIIEADHRRFEELRSGGANAIYGDASQHIILEAAGVARAKLVVLAIPSLVVGKATLKNVAGINGEVPVIARAEGIEQMNELYCMGVEVVVQPELEAGLELSRQALVAMEFDSAEIQNYADSVRKSSYCPITGMDEPSPGKVS